MTLLEQVTHKPVVGCQEGLGETQETTESTYHIRSPGQTAPLARCALVVFARTAEDGVVLQMGKPSHRGELPEALHQVELTGCV